MEKALLIGVNNHPLYEEQIEETINLALTLDIETEAVITQNLTEPQKVFYFGKGKLEEVRQFIEENGINLILVNSELSPLQFKNLSKYFDVEILDRTQIILEIFALRARSREAKVQVELAYLQYLLPRLTGGYEALDRQRGGKNRGLGEKKLELDKRRIEKEIVKYKKELLKIEKQRQNKNKRKKMSGLPKVSFVGYTNAGKSTLMNLFLEVYNADEKKKVIKKDMLFTTLDTTSRRIDLDDERSFILSDTVGFISLLPTLLIESFKSTLKEILESDLLINVVDFSSKQYENQKEVTLATLRSIGARDIPIIHAYNKIDLPSLNEFKHEEDVVYISASNRIGFDDLIERIKKELYADEVTCKMFIPYENSEVFAYLSKNGKIFNNIEKENGMEISIRCSRIDYDKYEKYVIEHGR